MHPDITPKPYTQYQKGGSIYAKGQVISDVPMGYWEWFRKKDGMLLRLGKLKDGFQVGKWTTYDKNGQVYKVTDMKDGGEKTGKTSV